ncbi:MAG: SCO family protein [Mariniblastus sp.]
MRYAIPIALWTMVLIGAGLMWFRSSAKPEMPSAAVTIASDGAVMVDVPWEHLPDVDRFKLIDQNGNEFDSVDLVGKPYVVSFFFASCPSFCRDLNNEIFRVNKEIKNTDIQFLTLTVQPEKDTPEVLAKYASDYQATPDRWAFLTGQLFQLKAVGERVFNVPVDPATHTDNILLVDKWGRYRDRFKWSQPLDMKRFVKVAKEVAAETEPPLGKIITTRNAMAGFEQTDLEQIQWVREFYLTERSGEKFYSRDMVGEVWIANFFFSTCPGICKKQNEYLRDLQKRIGEKSPTIVSITTKPNIDTPEHLREYANSLNADEDKWLFCTGPSALVSRIGSEFFEAVAKDGHHSSQLFVVDRWGEVRGNFNWEDPAEEVEMLKLIDQLKLETRPQKPVDKLKPKINEEDGRIGKTIPQDSKLSVEVTRGA